MTAAVGSLTYYYASCKPFPYLAFCAGDQVPTRGNIYQAATEARCSNAWVLRSAGYDYCSGVGLIVTAAGREIVSYRSGSSVNCYRRLNGATTSFD